MSRAAGEHERRGARVARVGLPRGTARSHEPLPGEHVLEKSEASRAAGGREQGHARVRERSRGGERPERETAERPYSRERRGALDRGWGREPAYTSSHLMPACSVVIN